MMVEVRSLRVLVSSHHPSADEQVAEAIARVASRYAVDLTPEIEVNVPQAGINVPYVAKAVMKPWRPASNRSSAIADGARLTDRPPSFSSWIENTTIALCGSR
jgi:hypothetical protein